MRKMLFYFVMTLILNNYIWGQELLRATSNLQQKPTITKGQLLKSNAIQRNQTARSLTVVGSDLFYDDFEGSTDNWVRIDSPWQIGAPTYGPSSGYSSTKCAGTNLSGTYSSNLNSWFQSKAISLPTLSSSDESIVLKFDEWYQLESGYDYGYVYIRANGGSWIQLSNRTGTSDWVESEIDLTTYAGDDVEILFYLTSDGSNEYAGWYIDNVKVQVLGIEPLTTKITSLDPTKFPFIYMNVLVDTFNTGITTLTKDNFTVLENDVVQTDYFDVSPPETSGGTRLADVIFVLDVSGSMGDEIDAVKANMEDFINSLDESGVDYRVGFITFADIIYVYNDYELYEGKDNILSIIENIQLGEHGIGDGGDYPENQLKAMAEGSHMNFRPGSQKIEIMLTDAIAHENDGVTTWTVSSLIDQLLASDVNCYPVFNTGDTNQQNQYIPIAEATNPDGKYYYIYDNFNEIINDISTSISNTYVIHYKSSDPEFNGIPRNVEVRVNYNGETSSDFASYTPGAAPRIERTETTKVLHDKAWAEGTSFTIEVNITDNIEPYVQSATLYYRTTGNTDFENVPMTLVSGNLYRATIPVSVVLHPGIDYYISATDGQVLSTDPLTDPRLNPYQIAVLPNEAPKIVHTPLTTLIPGKDLTVVAEVSDVTNTLTDVALFYRETGQLLYTGLEMINTSGNTYSAVIPGSAVTMNGVDYYIKATDDFGVSSYHGTADNPHRILSGMGAPTILSIIDVPNDQGGKVLITWNASSLDNGSVENPVQFYSIWRAIPVENKNLDVPSVLNVNVDKDFKGEATREKILGGNTIYWEWIANQPAHKLPDYSYVAETLYDSMSTTPGWHYFFISAHTATEFYDSSPDSGYSVDNLAPAPPIKVFAVYYSETKEVRLTWEENLETDLKLYNVFRKIKGTSDWQWIGSTPEPQFSDHISNPEDIYNYIYSVNAEDVHENVSKLSEAVEVVTSIEKSDNRIPEKFELKQNYPNPFNPTTTISFNLPKSKLVNLIIYNASGQKIRTLFQGNLNPGNYKTLWDGTDDTGKHVSSGVYLYQIRAGDFVQTRKMVLMK